MTENEEVTSQVLLAALLREAAGVSSADWVMAEAEVRDEIHERGLRSLVEAAGWELAAWVGLREFTRSRSDVLLAGARVLGVATSWEGWE